MKNENYTGQVKPVQGTIGDIVLKLRGKCSDD
jgi:hypothetical protein